MCKSTPRSAEEEHGEDLLFGGDQQAEDVVDRCSALGRCAVERLVEELGLGMTIAVEEARVLGRRG